MRRSSCGRLFVTTLAVLFAASPAGCGGLKKPVASAQAQPPFSIDLQFSPSPPQVGTEQFTVSIRDGSGAPVTGAKVQILPSYESVPGGHLVARTGMGGTSATLNTTDAGDGTYHAQMILAKAVYWTFTVETSIGTKYALSYQRGVQVQ